MSFFQIMFKYGWLLFIVITFINVYIFKYHSKKYIAKNPLLKEGYFKLFKGILIYFNIPWLIMGIGMSLGMTENIFEYMYPNTLNPIVLIFNVTLIVLWCLCFWWIFVKKGAEFLVKHPGLIRLTSLNSKQDVSIKQIKLIVGVMIFGGIAAMILMWTNYYDLPLNNLKQFSR